MNNLHTHTFRCKHAAGDAADYAAAALSRGVQILGITDHTPLPDGRWESMRMGLAELGCYIQAIEEARLMFPGLQIWKGMECEYSREYHGFFADELLGTWKLDYLIASVHFFPLEGRWTGIDDRMQDWKVLKAYATYMIEAMRSGLFAFVAHPDMFGIGCGTWGENAASCARDILEAAADLQLPLEINGYGFRKPRLNTTGGVRPMYPLEPFWEIAARYKITVIANSDAHAPLDVAANIGDALAIARKYGLQLADPSRLRRNGKEW
ncbi:MAG: histidinol-phosphatase [Bacillota bacterium]